jgi:pimeloyl-ACP methyl ester carboxylesterase
MNTSSRKWLVGLLLASGISYVAGYLAHRYRPPQVSASLKPAAAAIHLNRYYHFTELMRDPAIDCQLLHYRSEYDQSQQAIFIMQPAGHKSTRLFFFFHGMDGDSGDATVVREIVKKLDATVISLGGRGPSWVSDALLADAAQVIKNRKESFAGYYLIGISMGGTQALALAGLLPDDLRQSLRGVIALIPGADLPAIETRSSSDLVKKTMRESVGGNVNLLELRSPRQLLDKYPASLPFVIFYDRQDSILLTAELEQFISALRSRSHPVATFSVAGEHDFSFHNFDYQQLIKGLGGNQTENTVPLLPAAN